jgi:hypothetical protein
MLKENQVSVAGRVSKVWNNKTKAFEIMSGVSEAGNKYHIFEISVSQKDQKTGAWVNGKGLKVVLTGDVVIEEKTMVGIVGRLQPDNFTTKDGKEVRGLVVQARSVDMYVPEEWEAKVEA